MRVAHRVRIGSGKGKCPWPAHAGQTARMAGSSGWRSRIRCCSSRPIRIFTRSTSSSIRSIVTASSGNAASSWSSSSRHRAVSASANSCRPVILVPPWEATRSPGHGFTTRNSQDSAFTRLPNSWIAPVQEAGGSGCRGAYRPRAMEPHAIGPAPSPGGGATSTHSSAVTATGWEPAVANLPPARRRGRRAGRWPRPGTCR